MGCPARADVASLHLVIADLLLKLGQERQAEWEIRSALPVIIEEKMVPEGIAALSLLEQSLKGRRIDRQALRDLHGYFRQEQKPPRQALNAAVLGREILSGRLSDPSKDGIDGDMNAQGSIGFS